jgi:WD40 repeat protein
MSAAPIDADARENSRKVANGDKCSDESGYSKVVNERVDYVVMVTACNEVLLLEARPAEADGGLGTIRRRVRLLTQGHQGRPCSVAKPGADAYDARGTRRETDTGSVVTIWDSGKASLDGDRQLEPMLRCCPIAAHPSIPSLFATGGLDGTVRVWNSSTASMVALYLAERVQEKIAGPKQQQPAGSTKTHPVTAVAWSGKVRLEHHVAVGTQCGTLHVVLFTQGRRMLRLLQALYPTPIQRMVSGASRNEMTGENRRSDTSESTQDSIIALKYRRDGSMLAGGTNAGYVYVWLLVGPNEYVLGDEKNVARRSGEESGQISGKHGSTEKQNQDQQGGIDVGTGSIRAETQDPIRHDSALKHDSEKQSEDENADEDANDCEALSRQSRPQSRLDPGPRTEQSDGALHCVTEMKLSGHSILSLDWATFSQSGVQLSFLRATTRADYVLVWQLHLSTESQDSWDTADVADGRKLVLEEVAAGSAWAKRLGDLRWETWTSPAGWNVEGLQPALPARPGALSTSNSRSASGGGLARPPSGTGALGGRGTTSAGTGTVLVDCSGTGKRESMWTRDLAVGVAMDGTVRLARAPALVGARLWQARLMPEVQWQGPFGNGAGLAFTCDGKRVVALMGGLVRVLSLRPIGELGHEDPHVRAERRAALVVTDADREVWQP